MRCGKSLGSDEVQQMTDLIHSSGSFENKQRQPDALMHSPHSPQEIQRRLKYLLAKRRLSLFNPYRGKVRKDTFRLSPVVPMQQGFNIERFHGTYAAHGTGSKVSGRFGINWIVVLFPVAFVILFFGTFLVAREGSEQEPVWFIVFGLVLFLSFFSMMFIWQWKWHQTQRRHIVRDLAEYLDADIEVLPPSGLKPPPPPPNNNQWPSR